MESTDGSTFVTWECCDRFTVSDDDGDELLGLEICFRCGWLLDEHEPVPAH